MDYFGKRRVAVTGGRFVQPRGGGGCAWSYMQVGSVGLVQQHHRETFIADIGTR